MDLARHFYGLCELPLSVGHVRLVRAVVHHVLRIPQERGALLQQSEAVI
jgi:hypothetical protein